MTGAKRFYEDAAAVAVAEGFAIELDGRPVRTPMGKPLVLPARSLAEAIAAEWRDQGDAIDPHSMPLSGLANTAIDRVGQDRQTVLDSVLSFAETDLLCYRAEQPNDLVSRQAAGWQPLLDWAGESFGAQLRVTTGVLPVDQPAEALRALTEKLYGLDDMELTAVASLAAACGSLILALAVAEERIDHEQAFHLSQLDETYQNERWGLDSEAEDRQRRLRRDLASAALFLAFLKG